MDKIWLLSIEIYIHSITYSLLQLPLLSDRNQSICSAYNNPSHTTVDMHVMHNPQGGKTALDIAEEKGHSEIVKVLKTYQSKVRCRFDHQVNSKIIIVFIARVTCGDRHR